MDVSVAFEQAPKRIVGARGETLSCLVRKRLGKAMCCYGVELLTVVEAQAAVPNLAKRARLFENGIENRLEVPRRRIDDLQHLGGRGLLIQCFTRLGEQPRVLHRDDRLGREVFEESNLLFRKQP